MPRYIVERTVTTVQWAEISASSPEDAREEATHNPHLLDWSNTSENDPVITEVNEN